MTKTKITQQGDLNTKKATRHSRMIQQRNCRQQPSPKMKQASRQQEAAHHRNARVQQPLEVKEVHREEDVTRTREKRKHSNMSHRERMYKHANMSHRERMMKMKEASRQQEAAHHRTARVQQPLEVKEAHREEDMTRTREKRKYSNMSHRERMKMFHRERMTINLTKRMNRARHILVVKSADSDAGGLFIAAVDRVCSSKDAEPERVAVDCEGVNHSRLGSVELISVCFSSMEVFLVDVGGKLDPDILKAVKELFEDAKVTKIIHDCRMDSDALFHFMISSSIMSTTPVVSMLRSQVTGRADDNLNNVLMHNGVEQNHTRDRKNCIKNGYHY